MGYLLLSSSSLKSKRVHIAIHWHKLAGFLKDWVSHC